MTPASSGNSHAPGDPDGSDRPVERGFSRPLILGHRGSPRQFLENTLRSFDVAVRSGADGVELDVRSARDGVPVVLHDDSLERVMGVLGLVSELAWAAVQKLSEARVPSFEQVAAWAAASGAWLNVEMKSGGIEDAVLRRIHEFGIADRVVVSSFDDAIVRRVGELDDGIRRYFLTERWDDRALRSVADAGAAGVCLRDDGATERALADLRDRGLPVIVWTVNEARRVMELLEAGAAGVISDLPGMAAAQRDAFLGG